MDLHGQVREFVHKTLTAMGLPLTITIQDLPDSVRIDLSHELLFRRSFASPSHCAIFSFLAAWYAQPCVVPPHR